MPGKQNRRLTSPHRNDLNRGGRRRRMAAEVVLRAAASPLGRCSLALSAGALFFGSPAKGDTITTWTGTTSTAYNDPLNWSNGVANGAFTAVIPGGTPFEPVTNISPLVDNLTLSTTTASLTLSDSQNFNIDASGGGVISNNGNISLHSTGGFAQLLLQGTNGTVTLSGSGSLSLSDQTNNRILAISSGMTLVNNSTIQGAGVISNASSNFVIINTGTITASGSNALVLDPGSGLSNSGKLQAGASSTLILQNDVFTNTGTISAATGGIVNLSNATVSGGTFQTSGTGIIQVPSGTSGLSGNVTIATGSRLSVADSANLSLNSGSTYTNNGTLALSSSAGFSQLFLTGTNGTVTHSGSGILTLTDSVNNRIIANSGGVTLVNNSTIQGAGTVVNASNNFTLINNGTITATGNSGLTLTPGLGVTNAGTLQAATGGTLILRTETFTNTGAGFISASNGGTVTLSNATVSGGALQTSGTGIIQVPNGTSALSNGVTIATGALLSVADSANLSLASGSTYTNNGTLALNASAGFSQLFLTGTNGTVTLSGSGILSMTDSVNNRIVSSSGGVTLVNNSTIQGAGAIVNASNNFSFINNGTITATGTTGLTLTPGSGLTNAGTLQAATGATLTLRSDTFTNTGSGFISAANGATVTLSGATISGGTLQTSGSGVIQVPSGGSTLSGGVTIASGSLVQAADGSNLSLVAGSTYTNNGTLALSSTGGFAQLLLSGTNGTVTLNGSGILSMTDQTGNRIIAVTSGLTLVNNSTIQGAGVISNASNNYALINTGTITAKGVNTLVLQPGGGVSNTGTLQAGTGGSLVLQVDTFTNSGAGVISAVNGGTVSLAGATVNGGTLQTTGTGVIQIVPGAATVFGNSLTIASAGQVNVTDNSSLFLSGGNGYTINGALSMKAGSSTTQIELTGNAATVTLSGTGQLDTTDNTLNRIIATSGSMTLVNKGTIIGAPQFSNASNVYDFLNNGSLTANLTSPFQIFNGGAFTNAGLLGCYPGSAIIVSTASFTNFSSNTLSGGIFFVGGTFQFPNADIINNAADVVLSGGTSRIQDASANDGLRNFANNLAAGRFSLQSGRNFTSAGVFANAGAIQIDAGTTFATGAGAAYTQSGGTTRVDGTLSASTISLNGGTLSGSGTVSASGAVINAATVSPGDSPGKLTISGGYQQTSAGTLNIEINGLTQVSQYDLLSVTGSATLGGTLRVTFGFTPTFGQSFDILKSAGLGGTKFSTLVTTTPQGYYVQYTPTDVFVVVPEPSSAGLIAFAGAALLQRRRRSGSPVAMPG